MVSVHCATIELKMHLGGLLSTQEASFVLSNLDIYSCTLHAHHFFITSFWRKHVSFSLWVSVD